jgi:glutamate synthase (NADPH/NADH) small chain
MTDFLMNEVNKCIKCRNAKCTAACPISTDVPTIMNMLEKGLREDAKKLLFDNNPFSYVCSLVCDHDAQCFGNCILNFKNDPVYFYKIEEELGKEYLNEVHFDSVESNNIKIAIIGAGPAGITAAIKLAQLGYACTIFDKFSKIGGVLRYGIPKERLAKDIITKYEVILKELNVKFKPNCEIGLNFQLSDLLNDGYESIFLATGAWYPKPLKVKGETLSHVHTAIDYLRSPEDFDLGNKVIVIGAGNVAMDAAIVAKNSGHDTYIYYRKTFENMPASKKEIQNTRDAGIKFVTFKAPHLITSKGIYFNDAENVLIDGKLRTKVIEDTIDFVECDAVITAVSQCCDVSYINDCVNVELTPWNTVVTNSKFQTTNPDIFAGGDIVTGANTVVSAVNQAKLAAISIDKYLKEKLND